MFVLSSNKKSAEFAIGDVTARRYTRVTLTRQVRLSIHKSFQFYYIEIHSRRNWFTPFMDLLFNLFNINLKL